MLVQNVLHEWDAHSIPLREKRQRGVFSCARSYLFIFGDVVSIGQKDTYSLCELNCLPYSFSEQT